MANITKENCGRWCARITVYHCNKFYGETFQCETKSEIQHQMKLALNEMAKKEQPSTDQSK